MEAKRFADSGGSAGGLCSSAGSLNREAGGLFPFAVSDIAKDEVIAVWDFWRVLKKRLSFAREERMEYSRHGM